MTDSERALLRQDEVEMLDRANAATDGPWRKRRCINNDERDRCLIVDVVYGISAGEQKGPFENKGHFHPENEFYYTDEIDVVAVGMDRDFGTYEAAIEKEPDAEFIANARTDVPELLRRLAAARAEEGELRKLFIKYAAHPDGCSFNRRKRVEGTDQWIHVDCTCGLDAARRSAESLQPVAESVKEGS